MDMWHFLTNGGNHNNNNNNFKNNDENDDKNSDNNNNNGDKGQLCLGLTPDEARAFVRQGNLGYLKVSCLSIINNRILLYPNLT